MITRRVLLAAGGLMLLGECVAAEGSGAKTTAAAGTRARHAVTAAARPGTAARTASPHATPHGTASRRPASGPSDPDGPGGTAAARPGHGHPSDDQPMYTIDDGRKAIALTIDDGPSPLYTPQILRLLRKYRVTASFSMIGVNVAAHPGVARDVAEAGHMIVNHTWTHADLAVLPPVGVKDQLTRANDAISKATGRHPAMFRAPYGAWSAAVLRRCEQMRLTPLDWSVDPRDWARPGVGAIVDNIMRYTKTGSIILEHDGGGDRSETVAALTIVLPRLLEAGYHFRTP